MADWSSRYASGFFNAEIVRSIKVVEGNDGPRWMKSLVIYDSIVRSDQSRQMKAHILNAKFVKFRKAFEDFL